jgi:hypothetical protein
MREVPKKSEAKCSKFWRGGVTFEESCLVLPGTAKIIQLQLCLPTSSSIQDAGIPEGTHTTSAIMADEYHDALITQFVELTGASPSDVRSSS